MLAQPENEDVRLFENQWIHPRERAAWQGGMQQVLLRLLEQRFGPVPVTVRRRVETLDSTEELNRLADQVLTASSLDELDLND